jgi:hypothetical protein
MTEFTRSALRREVERQAKGRFEHIIGLTATGRVTVDSLQLNRTELVNLRRLLYAAGEHPCPDPEDG